jgi:hypothetical protein
MGTRPCRRVSILFRLLSTQMTSCPTSAKHAPVTNPTYPEPTIVMFIISPYFYQHLYLTIWLESIVSEPFRGGGRRIAQCDWPFILRDEKLRKEQIQHLGTLERWFHSFSSARAGGHRRVAHHFRVSRNRLESQSSRLSAATFFVAITLRSVVKDNANDRSKLSSLALFGYRTERFNPLSHQPRDSVTVIDRSS